MTSIGPTMVLQNSLGGHSAAPEALGCSGSWQGAQCDVGLMNENYGKNEFPHQKFRLSTSGASQLNVQADSQITEHFYLRRLSVSSLSGHIRP